MSMQSPPRKIQRLQKGPVAWMINNPVTPNLLMIIFIIGGLLMSSQIKREVFPSFELDTVSISVSYPGSSPEEVEQGIILAIEEGLSGIEDIDEINATASEGNATVAAELRDGVDTEKVFQDIQAEVDRITTFPEDSEKPVVTLIVTKRQVLRLNLYGNVDYGLLRSTSDMIKDSLLQYDGISQVEIDNPRAYEVEVEVPESTLRRYNLSHEEIAAKIRAASVELPGGKIETSGGQILLRLKDRSDLAEEFATIPIITGSSGASVLLGDIATVKEGFEDVTRSSSYDGMPALQLLVYRVGKETPITVSDDTVAAMKTIGRTLPPGINWAVSDDRSTVYRDRLHMLLKNAFFGLALVLISLGLFMEFKLAFWVTMGIPVSFLGTLLFLPMFDVSINMISMFAFIIALGIVVDDAIIAGENIYEYRQCGLTRVQAAVLGARDVAIPITYSILTNIVAFMPMLFVSGVSGKVWRVIPIVVISTFAISWFESLLILPSHLAHSKKSGSWWLPSIMFRLQQRTHRLMQFVITRIYIPSLGVTINLRYLFVALMAGILLITAGYVQSGRIRMILMPRVEGDVAEVTATLPWGSPQLKLLAVQETLLKGLEEVVAQHGGKKLLAATTGRINENEIRLRALLTPSDERPISTGELTHLWREQVGAVSGLNSLLFESDRGGPGGGASLTVELSHRDIPLLDRASEELATRLADFPGVKDIDKGFAEGKMQYTYQVNEWGHSLNLNSTEVGRQLRSAWQGAIALRQQRANNEVTVRVRLPEKERRQESNIENMHIKTPGGTWVTLGDITDLSKAPGYTTITRRNSHRTVTVEANVVPLGDTQIVAATLAAEDLPRLVKKYPGLTWSFQGRQADRQESTGALAFGFLYALGGIYLLLAIPFRSYTQPAIVMTAIPFGIIGAVYGHLLMGYNLSLMSMMGMVALSGVVVNDSLVLIDFINKKRLEGETAREAVLLAGNRRFRPVLLTTLTTFGGLAPMIFETSRQARFMIPMAISLGFGILFATIITLALVPTLYLILDDLHSLFRRKEERKDPEGGAISRQIQKENPVKNGR